MGRLLFLIPGLMLISGCMRQVRHRDLEFTKEQNLKLDVYEPRKKATGEVLVFIHGGNWRSGNKSMYKFFGRGMARKGVTTVVANYRLSSETNYEGMALDVAKAVWWTKTNIYKYKGDPSKIFITGHSAGGHLAALVATDRRYFNSLGADLNLQGVILNDAFGLDMNRYLRGSVKRSDEIYYPVFSRDSLVWQKASPAFYLRGDLPAFLIMTGKKTFPAILTDNFEFYYNLKEFQHAARLVQFKGKRHIPMISQFYNARCRGYKVVLGFMRNEDY